MGQYLRVVMGDGSVVLKPMMSAIIGSDGLVLFSAERVTKASAGELREMMLERQRYNRER